MFMSLRKTSEWSILHPHPSSHNSTSSASSNLDPPLVPSNRRSIHNTTRFTSSWDSEELVTKYTTGGVSEDDFMSMVPLELPPSDLSTQSILQAAGYATSVKRHSLNASFGMLPMDRFLAGRDDPPVLWMMGMPPMQLPDIELPAREKPPLHIYSTLGLPFRQSAAWKSSHNGSPKTSWTKARQGKPAAQEPLEAKCRIFGEQASPSEKQDGPYSKIVQSANGKGQSSSSPSVNPNSRNKTGANANEGRGQTGDGRANNNIASQGGDGGGGAAGNGGNDPPKKSNGVVTEPADALDWVGYSCFLRRSKTNLDVRCMMECAANASQICKHLAKIHGYTNDNLYLVEPENNNVKHPNTRRGLCKVCYEVFDYFKKTEGYVQDANLMDRNEDKFLLEHIKYHEQVAKRKGKENASPDNQESTPLKYVAMMLLFGVRQSLNEIRAKHSIPFTKLEKAPVVKPEVQTPINTEVPASSAGHDHVVHTPPGSVSGFSFKRSFSPPEESYNPTRPQKRHKDVLLAHQDGLYFETRTQNTGLIQSPPINPNNAVLRMDSTVLGWNEVEMNFDYNGPSPEPYNPVYDVGPHHRQDDDIDRMRNLADPDGDSLVELEDEEEDQVYESLLQHTDC